MSDMYERLRAALPTAIFYPPASAEQIARVEQALGTQFPAWLRDLYLCCNGIQSEKFHDAYLLALERNDAFPYGLLDWNEFQRDQWKSNLPDLQKNRPEVEWERLSPERLLIVGWHYPVEWAVRATGEMEILNYDVRNEATVDVVARDLVEACLANEEAQRESEERLFRGRANYRGPLQNPPAVLDIDYLLDMLVRVHNQRDIRPDDKAHPGLYLQRATSQRKGEKGELFILNVGLDDEVRLATRDGNYPFEMWLKAWPFEEQPKCVVWGLKDALIRILCIGDALSLPWVDGNRPVPDAAEIRQIWRDSGRRDKALSAMADTLCRRDDRRREEENRLG